MAIGNPASRKTGIERRGRAIFWNSNTITANICRATNPGPTCPATGVVNRSITLPLREPAPAPRTVDQVPVHGFNGLVGRGDRL